MAWYDRLNRAIRNVFRRGFGGPAEAPPPYQPPYVPAYVPPPPEDLPDEPPYLPQQPPTYDEPEYRTPEETFGRVYTLQNEYGERIGPEPLMRWIYIAGDDPATVNAEYGIDPLDMIRQLAGLVQITGEMSPAGVWAEFRESYIDAHGGYMSHYSPMYNR